MINLGQLVISSLMQVELISTCEQIIMHSTADKGVTAQSTALVKNGKKNINKTNEQKLKRFRAASFDEPLRFSGGPENGNLRPNRR